MSETPWLADYLNNPPAPTGWRRRGNWPNTRTVSATSRAGVRDTRRKNLLPWNRPWGTASAEGPITRGLGEGGGGGSWSSPEGQGRPTRSYPSAGNPQPVAETRQSRTSLVATRLANQPSLVGTREGTLSPPSGTIPAGYRSEGARGTVGQTRVATRVSDSAMGMSDPSMVKEMTAQELRLFHAFPDFFTVDKETGQFLDIFKGHGVGGGRSTALGDMARGGLGSFNKDNPVSSFQGLSVKAASNFLFGMDDDELIQLQVQLANAGFYAKGKPPVWGVLDHNTSTAFADFIHAGLTVREGETVNDMIKKRTNQHLNGIEPDDGTGGGGGGGGARSGADESVLNALRQDMVSVTSAATLSEMIDVVAEDLMGMRLPAAKRDQIVDQLQARERQHYYATTHADRQNMLNNKLAARGPTGGDEIDAFMRVIAQRESNGNPNAVNPTSGAWGKYQMMYWPEWAAEAGVDPADRSERNQDIVARYKMSQYYANYGSWRDVAIAWYAGGGNLQKMKEGLISGNASEGDYPTINKYADDTIAALNAEMGRGSVSPNNGGVTYAAVADPKFVEKPVSEEEIRRMVRNADPAGFAASQFRDRATAFFDMLGPVVNYGF